MKERLASKLQSGGGRPSLPERPTAVLVRLGAPAKKRYGEKRPPRPQAPLASALPDVRKAVAPSGAAHFSAGGAHSAAKAEGSNYIAPVASHARYEMLGVQLGAGVNGSVWLARRRSDGRRVAMKISTAWENPCDLMVKAVEEFRALDMQTP